MSADQLEKIKTIRHEDYKDELNQYLTNPLHKRILKAYHDPDPIRAMENELGNILLEVLENEN